MLPLTVMLPGVALRVVNLEMATSIDLSSARWPCAFVDKLAAKDISWSYRRLDGQAGSSLKL